MPFGIPREDFHGGFGLPEVRDIEQEQNGLYRYDRTEKFPKEIYQKMREAIIQKAAIEEN